MSRQELFQMALALPLTERVELAQTLWESIDDAPVLGADADAERETIELALRRDTELTAGDVTGRSHEQVMAAARRALRCD